MGGIRIGIFFLKLNRFSTIRMVIGNKHLIKYEIGSWERVADYLLVLALLTATDHAKLCLILNSYIKVNVLCKISQP